MGVTTTTTSTSPPVSVQAKTQKPEECDATSTGHRPENGRTSPPEPEKAPGDGPKGNSPSGRKKLAGALGNLSHESGNASESADTGGLVDVVRATCRIRFDVASQLETEEVRLAHKEKRCGGADGGCKSCAHKKRRCGGADGGCDACALQRALRRAQTAGAQAANVAMRAHWRVDADLIDRFLLQEGRAPKGQEWRLSPDAVDASRIVRSIAPGLSDDLRRQAADKLITSKGQLYTYPLIRAVAPDVPAGAASAIARMVDKKWRQTRFDALVRCKERPVHYRDTMPLPIRRQDWTLQHMGQGRYGMSLNVAGRRWTVPVIAYDSYLAQRLRWLESGEAKPGEMKLQRDEQRTGVWYLRIAYTRKVRPYPRDQRVCGVTIGICTIVAAMGYDGDQWMYDGYDIEAYLRSIQNQRKRVQRSRKASNRFGRGVRSALQPTKRLEDKAMRYRDNKVQTIARRLARWIAERYTHVYVANFSGVRSGLQEYLEGGQSVWERIQTWPFRNMQDRLVSCLEEYGVTVTEIDPRGSTECPECFEDAGQIDLQARTFRCESCGYRRHLDAARSRRILRRGQQIAGQDEGGKKPKNGTSRKAGGRSLKTKKNGKKGRGR